MSYVEDPAFGWYGAWEAANPECVAQGLVVTTNTKMIQLLFASICACQVLFMASRAPRVTWEAVYLPFVETILYGMSASGNGSIRLSDGRMVPIARFCSWLITCPIMLFQVVGIFELKWKTISCKNMVMAASLIRTVFGIGASVTTSPTTRWVQYFLSCGFFFFELIVVYNIFQAGLKKFGAVKTRLNNIVYSRILFLRFLFFLSWASFPIIWLLSSTGLCLISENASVLSYLVADLICKNTYGIINANTLFRILNGKWIAETEEDTQQRKVEETNNHVGESYFEQMLAGIRGSRRRGDDAPDDRDAPRGLKEVRIDDRGDRDIDRDRDGYRDRPASERAGIYSEKMKNKAPEAFIDDRDLPRLDGDRDRRDRRPSRDDASQARTPSRGPVSYHSPSDDDDDRGRGRDRAESYRTGRSRDSYRDGYDDRGRDRDGYDHRGRDDYDDRRRDRDSYRSDRSRSRDPRARTESPE